MYIVYHKQWTLNFYFTQAGAPWLMHLKTVQVFHSLKPFICLFSVNVLKLGDQNQELSHYTSSSVTIRFKKIVLTSFCLGFGFCESVGFSVLEISCTKILSIHTCHKTAATEHSSRKIGIFFLNKERNSVFRSVLFFSVNIHKSQTFKIYKLFSCVHVQVTLTIVLHFQFYNGPSGNSLIKGECSGKNKLNNLCSCWFCGLSGSFLNVI